MLDQHLVSLEDLSNPEAYQGANMLMAHNIMMSPHGDTVPARGAWGF